MPGKASPSSSNKRPQQFIALFTVLFDPARLEDEVRIEAMQSIRKSRDRAASRWAPHITIVPPFTVKTAEEGSDSNDAEHASATEDDDLPFTSLDLRPPVAQPEPYALRQERRSAYPAGLRSKLGQLEDEVERALSSSSSPFSGDVSLDDVGFFPLSAYHTIHFRPGSHSQRGPRTKQPAAGRSQTQSEGPPSEPSSPLNALWSAVESAVARTDCRLQEGKRKAQKQRQQRFSPHLTLGQSTTREEKGEIMDQAWAIIADEPLLCQVRRLQLLFKPKSQAGPYLVWREFHLSPPA
ncbi:hypothetical protein OC834_000561 [Tilletia horrida]|nr:hypothetical protein OC834_000561 [Tilletia horrida]